MRGGFLCKNSVQKMLSAETYLLFITTANSFQHKLGSNCELCPILIEILPALSFGDLGLPLYPPHSHHHYNQFGMLAQGHTGPLDSI